MTSAHFKTLRERLGLPAQWVAAQLGVTHRTVQHWESGRNQPPTPASDLLRDVDTRVEAAVKRAVELVEAKSAEHGGNPEVVQLWRYRTLGALSAAHPEFSALPLSCHAAMLGRAVSAIAAKGFHAEVAWLD